MEKDKCPKCGSESMIWDVTYRDTKCVCWDCGHVVRRLK